jgi:acyl-CoA thioesterase-1
MKARARGERYWLRWLLAWALLAAGCGDGDVSRPAPAQAAPAGDDASAPVVLFLGTSLTAGYGLPSDEAYPALIQERIDDAGLDFRAVNAGVSGDTSAGGLRRIDWLLRLPVAVLVVELGANDMLRGLSADALRGNLRGILEQTRAAHPGTRFVLAGMRAAPNLGLGYARRFEAVFVELAQEYDAVLIPFLLEGVAGRPSLNQADGIHPTAEGQHKLADTVWEALEPVLRGRRAGRAAPGGGYAAAPASP